MEATEHLTPLDGSQPRPCLKIRRCTSREWRRKGLEQMQERAVVRDDCRRRPGVREATDHRCSLELSVGSLACQTTLHLQFCACAPCLRLVCCRGSEQHEQGESRSLRSRYHVKVQHDMSVLHHGSTHNAALAPAALHRHSTRTTEPQLCSHVKGVTPD